MIFARLCLLIAPVLAALALCGPAAAATPAPPDLATRPAAEIVSLSMAAMSELRSYRFRGTVSDEDGDYEVTGVAASSGSFRLQIDFQDTTSVLLKVPNRGYVRANRAYWNAVFGKGKKAQAQARRLADRWLTGRDARKMVTSIGAYLKPKNLAFCVGQTLGTLTVVGTELDHGRRVVLVDDKGDRPGGTPQRLSIALDGPPYLLRMVQTGRRTPGKISVKRCEDGDGKDDTTTHEESRFSGFDRPTGLRAPRHALDADAELS